VEARAVVECRGVTKRFGERVAVDALDLAVPAGVCFGILGPNGAGKTTTLKMIYGVTRPSAGEIRVFGIDVTRRAREVRARLGVTLQENALVLPLTPVENLRIFGRYHLLDGPELERRIEELLDFLALRSHADVPVRALSGGFQRRLSIALSLVNRPELLVLDEPTTGLDPAVRLSLWERIRALKRTGTTILLTTHYMDEAERLCDRIVILAQGRLVAEGAPKELIAKTLAPETLELELAEDELHTLGRELEGFRRLRAGRRVMLFSDDAARLLDRLRHRRAELGDDHRPVIVRPTNLEDVFLALTGTRLEGGA
jgi:lipooligosaccharide transport system ATP-binding protein